MANIVQDISLITKIVGCSYNFYIHQSNETDPYYESTLYLVNNGILVDPEVGSNLSYTDLYYGPRKLSDTLVVPELPESPSYPNDKIYLQPKYQDNIITGYQIYFKHDNIVIPIASVNETVQVNEIPDSFNLEIVYNVGGEQRSAIVLGADPNTGEIDPSIYNKLYTQLEAEFEGLFNEVLRWKHIGSSSTRRFSPQGTSTFSGNYNDLTNRPSVNGEILEGNKSTSDLHLDIGATTIESGGSEL